MLVFLAVTNRWMSWAAGYRLLLAHDEIDYRAIALAAPHLPSVKLQEQHAQRFPFHYLIGLVAHGLGVGVDSIYAVAVVLVAILLCGLLARQLVRLGLSDGLYVVCLAAFVWNAYSLRYYLLAPGELADLVFEMGALIALGGLLERRFGLVLGGIAVGTLARQTALPASIVAAAWVAMGPEWRDAGGAARASRAGLVVALAGVIYAAEVIVSRPFSLPTTPEFTHFTLLAELGALPSGLGTLGQHFLRSVNGLFAVLALLAVLLARRRGARSLPFAFWGTLLFALAVFLQPVVFSAQYAAHNETRLAVLALGPFVVLAALAGRELERGGPAFAPGTCAVLLAILAVDSLHHLYTLVGTADARQTLILQALAAAALVAVGWRATGRRDAGVATVG